MAKYLVVVLLLPLTTGAQTFTGTIVGRVLDSQDAAVVNASVTLINLEKEFERHAVANARGVSLLIHDELQRPIALGRERYQPVTDGNDSGHLNQVLAKQYVADTCPSSSPSHCHSGRSHPR